MAVESLPVQLDDGGVDKESGVRVKFAPAHIGVLQELRLAHQVCLCSIGQGHLVVKDRGVGTAP